MLPMTRDREAADTLLRNERSDLIGIMCDADNHEWDAVRRNVTRAYGSAEVPQVVRNAIREAPTPQEADTLADLVIRYAASRVETMCYDLHDDRTVFGRVDTELARPDGDDE